jgi:hypothetical protein
MSIRRGKLRGDDRGPEIGWIGFDQANDTPDDAIVIDLRKDEQSLNWTKYGPEDSRERFSEWSDEKARKRLSEVRGKLREVRQRKSGSGEKQ